MSLLSRAGIATTFAGLLLLAAAGPALSAGAPAPLLTKGGASVDWWFAFKFNSSKTFAGCVSPRKEGASEDAEERKCPFGGKVQTKSGFGQQFAFASSKGHTLQAGKGCAGATETDPIGATFDQVYNGAFHYVIWNDQFYRDPKISACTGDSCGAPWGHSKGLLAWNDAGEGFVMQVSTPAWPRSGSSTFNKRKVNKGNTLGCNASNNNLRASQHFFALKLDQDGLIKVLDALRNASVVTDPDQPQIVRNGGPAEIRKRVEALGTRPKAAEEKIIKIDLAKDVILISKPSGLHVPPWQMVSALMSSADERAATWWTKPWIYSTSASSAVKCWDDKLKGEKPGPVAIAKTGEWEEQDINLTAPSNHAKIGTAISGGKKYAVFGDMNQQGAVSPPGCDKSQNGRGGLFFAVQNNELFDSIKDLIAGDTAPTRAPKK